MAIKSIITPAIRDKDFLAEVNKGTKLMPKIIIHYSDKGYYIVQKGTGIISTVFTEPFPTKNTYYEGLEQIPDKILENTLQLIEKVKKFNSDNNIK